MDRIILLFEYYFYAAIGEGKFTKHSDNYSEICLPYSTELYISLFLGLSMNVPNIYPTRCNVKQFILSGNCYTCFGWYHHPSSGAQTTVSTASGICHTVTAICRYSGR